MTCRICDRPNNPFNDDGSINRDHALCDEIIREFSKPTIIPPGIGTREWGPIRETQMRAEYRRRAALGGADST